MALSNACGRVLTLLIVCWCSCLASSARLRTRSPVSFTDIKAGNFLVRYNKKLDSLESHQGTHPELRAKVEAQRREILSEEREKAIRQSADAELGRTVEEKRTAFKHNTDEAKVAVVEAQKDLDAAKNLWEGLKADHLNAATGDAVKVSVRHHTTTLFCCLCVVFPS